MVAEERASGEPLVDFVGDMRRLRAECDWKRAQTHRSLARYLLEETHETLEVLDAWSEEPGAANDAEHLCEELGDLLLQVYFHAAIAEERGDFTLDDVARGIIAKMHRRNPHVFGADGERPVPGGAAAVNDAWQAIKAAEQAAAPRSPTACRRDCPRCCTPTRCSTAGSSGAGPRAGRPRARGRRWATGCSRWSPRPAATGADPEQELRDAVRRRRWRPRRRV